MSNVINPTKPNQGQGGQRSSNLGQSLGGSNTMEKVKEGASAISERVSDAASYVGEKAMAAGSSAMHSAEEAASYVGKRADDGVHAVGSSLKSFGDTVRHTAPQRDMVKEGMCAVADTLENTGKYLEEEGLSGIASDVTELIKRNPIPALLIGIGVGFLLARACAPRS